MDQSLLCPQCHQPITPTDYFCANCGKRLKIPPLPTTIVRQIMIYLGSVILPPMGLVWGMRYLKQPDQKSKLIGIVAIVLTALSLVISTIYIVDYINKVNTEVTRQLNDIQGF
jgi:predicted amidophosphoribosyltransferase